MIILFSAQYFLLCTVFCLFVHVGFGETKQFVYSEVKNDVWSTVECEKAASDFHVKIYAYKPKFKKIIDPCM